MPTAFVASDESGAARRPSPCTLLLALAPTSSVLRIVTNDPEVERYVRIAYGNTLVVASSSVTDSAEVMLTAGAIVASFNSMPFEGRWAGTGESPWASPYFVVDQLVWRAIARDHGWFAVYGCAVNIDGHALLLAGSSGVGKTTTAIALHGCGARVIGDEMILIRRSDYTVDSIDRALSIRGEDGRGPRSFRAVARSGFGGPSAAARLATIAIVKRITDRPSLIPLATFRATLALASLAASRPGDLDAVAAIGSIVAAATSYTLELGQPDASAQLLMEVMRA